MRFLNCRPILSGYLADMWIFIYLLSYTLAQDYVRGQDFISEEPAYVINMTLVSDDGSYVDSRQITVTLRPPPALTTVDPNAVVVEPSSHTWTWTTFGEYSKCSTTCGAGLQVAERFCVSVMGMRVVEAAATVEPCLHQDSQQYLLPAAGQPTQKQYRRCESQPCPVTHHSTSPSRHENEIYTGMEEDAEEDEDLPTAPPGDLRFVLCSQHNDKEYADKKYSWIPFMTPYAPCQLLCRPSHEKFYVSFAPIVPNGLSCEKIITNTGTLDGQIVSSSTGVCLNGTCQAIGCDGIVGSNAQVDACGVCAGDSSACQNIRIDFLEENLPRGHNKIGTIPRGACNISLVEKRPSGNVFALRTVQGFFLNGEWTASATGDYAAAGSRFRYQHVTNGNSARRHGERITARGPLTEDIEIILVTKRRNTGITLQYSISNSNRQSKNIRVPSRRHRAEQVDLDNHIQIGPHRGDIPSIAEDFVDAPIQLETTPVPPPPTRPPELYKWANDGYMACSRTCGHGVRQSKFSCVARRDGRRVDEAYCRNVARPGTFQESCRLPACAGEWRYGDWSECSATCGTGTETRDARCKQPQGDGTVIDVSEDVCGLKPTHGITRPCQRAACASFSWRSGEWSPCDAACGPGARRRQVKCYDDTHGVEIGDEQCRIQKPQDQQACSGTACQVARGVWLFSEWDTKCSNDCGTGTSNRHLVCYKDNRQQDHRHCETSRRPETQQPCNGQSGCGGRWFEGPWSDCTPDCGIGSQKREVICLRRDSADAHGYPTCEAVDESECKYHPKPETQRQCQGEPCRAGSWYQSDWSPCSHSCGVGSRSRTVVCLDRNKQPSSDCAVEKKPTSLESCGNEICDDAFSRQAQRGPRPSYVDRPVDLNNKAGTLPDYPFEDTGARRPGPEFDQNNKAGTRYPYDSEPSMEDRRRWPPVDLNNKAGTMDDDRRYARPPIDLNNKAGTLYDSGRQADSRPPIDLNNKAGTLYDSAPQEDSRPRIDLNNKACTLCDSRPENDDRRFQRPPVDLNNKAGTLYDSGPQDDSRRRPVDLNNKAGTLYDSRPENDDRRYQRPPVDLNNKAGTLYDSGPQEDSRPRIDLNNKAGTLYDSGPQQDYRPPLDLNNKAGTLYDSGPQQDFRPPIDLNNKAGTLYDSGPQQDYRPPVDLNNKAGTLYDSAPQQDSRPPIDLNNKAGTLYDPDSQQDERPRIDLNNKAGTIYDPDSQQDDRGRVDLNNKAGTLYDSAPQADHRPRIDLNNKAGTMYDASQRPARPTTRKGDPGAQRQSTVVPVRPDTARPRPPPRTPPARRDSGVVSGRPRADGRVDIDNVPVRGRNPPRRVATSLGTVGGPKACVDKIDRCRTVKELAFCRYDYYKKMCCKSCQS